jgi:hypothetical protein
MRNGYIICGLAYDAAHIVLAADGLPPQSTETTDWSQFPMIREPRLLLHGTYFLLRIPGSAAGLYIAVERIMDVASVYREGYSGLDNHRLLSDAIGKIRRCTTDRVLIHFTLSPERIRQRELEIFQAEEASDWGGYLGCLEDPGCAEVLRRWQ